MVIINSRLEDINEIFKLYDDLQPIEKKVNNPKAEPSGIKVAWFCNI